MSQSNSNKKADKSIEKIKREIEETIEEIFKEFLLDGYSGPIQVEILRKDGEKRIFNIDGEEASALETKDGFGVPIPSPIPRRKKQTVPSIPEEKPAKTTPAKKPVKTTPAKKPVKTTPAKKPVKTTPAKKPVKTASAKKPVKTAPAKMAAKSPSKDVDIVFQIDGQEISAVAIAKKLTKKDQIYIIGNDMKAHAKTASEKTAPKKKAPKKDGGSNKSSEE